MTALSRRKVLQGSAALGALSFAGTGTASAAGPKTRYSAFSAEGKKALASYAKAVDAMVKRSQQDITDPLGWTYQYKMHLFPVNGDAIGDDAALAQARKADLDQTFGAAAPGNIKRAQAEATWGKCPHSGDLQAVDFMPWHRMYLFFFERIVRKLSGDDDFALPYWGYMDGKTSQIVPPEFTALPPNSLFHDRSVGSNQGDAMDENAFDAAFWDSSSAFNDFSIAVEGTPHADVHNIVGDGGKDMSSLFLSPRDPVFWLHHCEIDRIWEGGIKAKVPTPTGDWLTHKFNFFDENATFVELANQDVLKTEQIKTWPGYTYHDVPKRPAVPSSAIVAQASQQPTRRLVATAANVSLGGGLHLTKLAPTPAMSAMAAAPLSAEGPRRLKLEISGVALDRRTVANVGLYLNAPPNTPPEALRKYLVGTLSTFSLPIGSQGSHGGHVAGGPPAVRSFDVTRLVAELQRQGLWTGELNLTSREITGALGDAELKLGKVELVETGAGGTQQ